MLMNSSRVDIASITCSGCGHISTAPDAINGIPNQMENYGDIDGIHVPDKETEEILRQTLEEQHRGNVFNLLAVRATTTRHSADISINVVRSYCEVAYQSSTALEESSHIILSCPQCHAQLYEVKWRNH